MADALKPLPVKGADSESIDEFNSDFDANIKQQTAAARSRPLSDFPGEKPVDESSTSETSGSVDDDALRAAVTARPATEAASAAAVDVAKPEVDGKPTPAEPAQAAKPADSVKPAEPAKATEPAKPAYDPAEAFGLADGISLTREQITQGLRERQAWGQAATTFQQIFRCSPEQAQQFWKPYVDRLVAEPKLGDWVDASIATFDNPGKLAYIQRCAEFYDTEQPAPVAQPQAQGLPPEVRRELEESRRFRQNFETQNAAQQVASEKRDLVAQMPQLADEKLMQLVAQRTFAVLAEQERTGVPQTYRLADGARDMKHVIDRWGSPAQAAPAPTVPALNTSSGASASTKSAVDMKPRKFANPDEALADWDKNVAPSLGYK